MSAKDFMQWFPAIALFCLLGCAWHSNRTTGLLPDRLTFRSALLGILISAVCAPQVSGQWWWLRGASWSALGGLIGFVHTLLFAGLLKKLFGFRKLSFPDPAPIEVFRQSDGAFVVMEGRTIPLEEFFTRVSDVAVAEVEQMSISVPVGVRDYVNTRLNLGYGWFEIGGDRYDLELDARLKGRIRSLGYWRDMIGMGVVKLMLAVGTLVGWKGAIFIVWAAAFLVAFVWFSRKLLKLPVLPRFLPEPYLAAGALAWVVWTNAL
jgi:prepilin signal peptidase PulO-like enzyme (type II secretory pathway)